MRKNKFEKNLLLLLPLLLLFIYPISAQTEKPSKPTVLVLGTYHFSGNGEDITSGKRQKEVKAIVKSLKEFAPTKIAVEIPFDKSDRLNSNYQKYLKSEYELGKVEIYQVGFRLARELNHQKIYPIDWRNKFDLNSVFAYAKENDQVKAIQPSIFKMSMQEATLRQMIKTKSLVEILNYLNSDEAIKNVDRLMLESLVHVGKDENYIGTDVLAGWYERNLKIFTNITRTIETKDERVLVIIGVGHANLLRQFIEDSGLYKLEKPDKYLQ